MDKNTVIGFILIFGILFVWNLSMKDDADKMLEEQRIQDSTAQLEQVKPADEDIPAPPPTAPAVTQGTTELDSAGQVALQNQLAQQFGPFAAAASGEEETVVLENNLLRITFTNKGGHITEVLVKEHFKVHRDDSTHEETKVPLKLMEDEKDRFEYFLPVANVPSGAVKSTDLFFQIKKEGENKVVFTASAGGNSSFEQVYTLKPDSYHVDYELRFNGLDNLLSAQSDAVRLNWVNYLDKLELNDKYSRTYASVYYKPTEDDYDYCSCTGDDEEDLSGQRVEWFAHSNQFFASLLMSKNRPFRSGIFTTEMIGEEADDLKKLSTQIDIPLEGSEPFAMEMYIGPKDFETLSVYGNEAEYIVPYGKSIIGTANRWVIRPMFNFLSSFISSKGIVILLLTLIVKLVLYPLMYKMLYSQAKMAALKPRLSALKEKYKDDQSQAQMESMKLYREFGVNPLGGCLPVVLQMPIWLALYRFFPAAIEFRQEGFLWATDLSSYDAAIWLPFAIPGVGHEHLSLFTLLWVVTTLIYTYYNMQQMDMANMGGANAKMMKYMQFLMPVFFLFFFNGFASGLTCYLVFSNLFNIAQTIITKQVIIDHDKIKEQLEAYKKKPKKKGGFQSRLEQAMQQQKTLAAQREAAKSDGKRKKK